MSMLIWDNLHEGWICNKCGDDIGNFGFSTPLTYGYNYCPICGDKIESIKKNGLIQTREDYLSNRDIYNDKGIYWFDKR